MGLLKRMLARGLSGAEPIEARSEPTTAMQWPPDPPPNGPPLAPASEPQVPGTSVFGLEEWRYPISLNPRELRERGFERAEIQIRAAFEANGQTIELTHSPAELAVNEVVFDLSAGSFDATLQNSVSGETHQVDAAIWAVGVALHNAYLEPLDPERTWQIATVGRSYVLFLARPEELQAITRRREINTTLDVGKLVPAG